MFAKVLASAVAVVALGIGGYTFYAGSTSTGSKCGGCPLAALGLTSQESASPCCAVKAPCCSEALSCCSEEETLVSTAVAATPECCFVGSPCCDSGDCCLLSYSVGTTTLPADAYKVAVK